MNRKIEFFGTEQVRNQINNQTIVINWDIATVQLLIARRLTLQGNGVVFKQEPAHIEHGNGNRTELVPLEQ